jgi:Ran GTPase-activating protein (RanGAP) involved in mRNA processing and transport
MSKHLLEDSVEDFAPLVHCQPVMTNGGTRFGVVNGKLDLSGISLDFRDAEEVALMIKYSTNIKVLKLCFNGICPVRAKMICKAIKKNNSIEVLILGWNEKMGSEGILYLCKALTKNKRISEVTLHKNYINDDGASYIFDLLKTNTTIKRLNLQGNKITSKGAQKLAKALKVNTTLKHLDLRSNLIETDGCLHIVKALFKNSTLEVLDMGYNSIGPMGAMSFGELLLSRPALTQLGLAGNAIDDDISSLYDAIEANPNLKVIDLRYNKVAPISPDILKNTKCEVIFSPRDVAAY